MKLPRILRPSDEFVTGMNRLRAADEAAKREPRPESECSQCGLHVTRLGGMWTADDGDTCCYADPAPEWTPHKPKEA